jgi:hypothetical protein
MRSIAVIRCPRIVKRQTTRGRPPGIHTAAAPPSTIARAAPRAKRHERHPLGGREGVEDDQERTADRVGEQRLVLGIGLAGVGDRFGQVGIGRRLGPGAPRLEHVQADAGDDGGEPAAEVLDGARVRAAEAQPGLLDGVVGVVGRAEDAVRDRPQAGPVLLEALGEPLALPHLVTFLAGHRSTTA